jgi:hypothetical protein
LSTRIVSVPYSTFKGFHAALKKNT